LNILKNCIDILIARNVSPKVVHVAFIDMEDKIRITIHDNGGGIEDEYLSKIFDPYFTTKHKSQGVGLGLYISAKNIKEHFNGDLYVKNEEMIVDGKEFVGAKFIIEFQKESNSTLQP
jgi:C4-dicarboxylate-specific signal transduction histidine kinase